MDIEWLNLEQIFKPSSLALIGASRDESKTGTMFLKSILASNFTGQIYPVNPRASELLGLKCYPNIFNIPESVNLAIITLPAQVVFQTVKECVDKKVKFALIHSAGFSESGTEGKKLEAEVVDIARRGGLRIIGPNSMGMFCPQVGLNTVTPWHHFPPQGNGASFVGQSGWVSENFIIISNGRGLRLSKVVNSGNESDLTTIDFLQYFAHDTETKVIASYVEGIKDGKAFIRRIKKINMAKPVVIHKGGKTTEGARAVASHTSSIAGSNSAFDAVLKQSGVIRAQNMDELIDFTTVLTCPYLPSGNRLGILVESGGGAVAAADACSVLGLELPATPTNIEDALRSFLTGVIPTTASLGNPIDLVWPPYGDKGIQVIDRCIDYISEFVDAFLLVTFYLSLPDTGATNNFIQRIEQVRDRIKKPVILVPAYGTEQRENARAATLKGIPAFPTPERAVKAISVLVQRSAFLQGIHD